MPEPAIESSPPATFGFGARESADETRQAQQTVSNDAPTDVNMNAIIARSQALTHDVLGKNFEANATRRASLFDHFAAMMAKLA